LCDEHAENSERNKRRSEQRKYPEEEEDKYESQNMPQCETKVWQIKRTISSDKLDYSPLFVVMTMFIYVI
jgi:hypothetical protein